MAAGRDDRFYVYMHTFPDGSIYLGKGSWSRAYHFGDQRRGYLWLRTKNKYGRPSVSFLIRGITEDLSYFIEQEAIGHYRALGDKLRNLSDGGIGGCSGLTGELSPNYGRVRRKDLVEQHRRLMTGSGNPRYGEKLSDETKRKISEARTGTDTYLFSRDSGDTFSGTRYDFQEKYGINIKSMFCKNPRRKVQGWRVSPSQLSMN